MGGGFEARGVRVAGAGETGDDATVGQWGLGEPSPLDWGEMAYTPAVLTPTTSYLPQPLPPLSSTTNCRHNDIPGSFTAKGPHAAGPRPSDR